MMRHVEMLPNKDLAQEFPRNIAYILLSGLWICFIQCGEVRLNCSFLRPDWDLYLEKTWENAVCEKRDARILAPSWNLPAWKDSLLPWFSILQLTSSSVHASCIWSVFWPSTNALLTSLSSQQVGIFDTLIRKARTCGILAKSSAVPHWCHAIQWRHIVKSSLRKRTWRSGNQRWSAFGSQT